jgi:hypothetical protein
MTLEEVIEAVKKRYRQVETRTGPGGGVTLIVDGFPFVLSAWFPEDGVTRREREYLLAVLYRLEPIDLDLVD